MRRREYAFILTPLYRYFLLNMHAKCEACEHEINLWQALCKSRYVKRRGRKRRGRRVGRGEKAG